MNCRYTEDVPRKIRIYTAKRIYGQKAHHIDYGLYHYTDMPTRYTFLMKYSIYYNDYHYNDYIIVLTYLIKIIKY